MPRARKTWRAAAYLPKEPYSEFGRTRDRGSRGPAAKVVGSVDAAARVALDHLGVSLLIINAHESRRKLASPLRLAYFCTDSRDGD